VKISEILSWSVQELKKAGIETAGLDSEILISFAEKIDRIRLVIDYDKELFPASIKKIKKIILRRAEREPLAYITGIKEFYSLDFMVNENVLIPRPETELLVDMLLYHAPLYSTIIDIGTGSGAIAVSAKYNRKDLDVHASDISEKALKTAKKNSVKILGPKQIKFYHGNLFESFGKIKFNCIVSNPPYIDPLLRNTLQKELSYEPSIALYADDSGKVFINKLISASVNYLLEKGILLIEIGHDQKDFVIKTGLFHGYEVSVLNDYAGFPRVAVLKK
jgi:release factor glutamine methyltransferase